MTDVASQALSWTAQQDLRWQARASRGQQRCCARTAAGHQCTRSAAPGNEGFCGMHRRSETSRLHPAQVEARRQQARERNITLQQLDWEQNMRMQQQQTNPEEQQLVERRRIMRAWIDEVGVANARDYLDRGVIPPTLLAALSAEQSASASTEQAKYAKMQQYKKLGEDLIEQHKDPVQVLLDKGELGHAVLVSCFHDRYVEWKKQQPNYEPEECAICIDPCDDCPKYQSCGHAFHHHCIARWKRGQRKPRCPCCRSVMLSFTQPQRA